MQNSENCHENVWILSGTSDGPSLAKRLLDLNYSVFASVVTFRASKSYSNHPKLHIITGKLIKREEIVEFIRKNKIKLVIDATHPFALIISEKLKSVCNEINTPFLVFERESLINKSSNFHYISNLKDIDKSDLKNKNILLAIGSRSLNDTANYYMNCGANVFARIFPIQESVSKAFGSCIKNSNIAILEPSKKKLCILEKQLCKFWHIDYVLCRESGSYSQKNWEEIIMGTQMKLFLVRRPESKNNKSNIFSEYQRLIDHIRRKY